MTETIAVALSGGVDSSMAAHLLQAAGRRVRGVHFLTGHAPAGAVHGVQAVADQLGISLDVVDLTDPFHRQVVNPFIQAYRAGQTPNPCFTCNREIKFGALLRHAQRRGIDYLATGHYARIGTDFHGHVQLRKGIDAAKDQSYFLAGLNPDQLAAAIFPLGETTKAETLALARQRGLIPAHAKESQDICFIPDGDYIGFMHAQTQDAGRPGPIVDVAGRQIGAHQGLHRFTIGQRRGIGCPAARPYYVVRLDVIDNRLVVGHRSDLSVRIAQIADINWIQPPNTLSFMVQVRVRYRHQAVSARLTLDGKGGVQAHFDSPQMAITPGQAAVFYKEDVVLGSGRIVSSQSESVGA